jgi:hypothetical protein
MASTVEARRRSWLFVVPGCTNRDTSMRPTHGERRPDVVPFECGAQDAGVATGS